MEIKSNNLLKKETFNNTKILIKNKRKKSLEIVNNNYSDNNSTSYINSSNNNDIEGSNEINEINDNCNSTLSIANKFFYFLTFICYLGTAILIFSYNKYWQGLLVYKPLEYQIPKFSDFKIILYAVPIISLIKIAFESALSPVMYKYVLSKKYKNLNDESNFNLGFIYKKKLATNLYKVVYYSLVVLFSYSLIKDMDYFPYEILGKGDMINIFKNGSPGYIFFEKPKYFDMYYLISVAFVITDLIWLLFVYETQSDYPLMLLHHSVTISLILFSYLTNLSQIGVIVLFLHDATDILVYVVRIVINTDCIFFVKVTLCSVFLLSYIYLRLYVLGKLIIVVGLYMDNTRIHQNILWYFKIVLIIMHLYWVSQITSKLLNLNISDVAKIKKKKH